MSGPLTDKVALVTGGARGIGRACARKLASAGCDVVVNYYNSHEEAEGLCNELRGLGRRSIALQASVGDPSSMQEMFEALFRQFERLDIVVSNAASGVLKPALEMKLKHWRWCMETNAFALALLAQHAVQRMDQGGRIIAMSSLGAQRAPAGPTLSPEDVANAVYLLCLPEAAMINGATLVVDGGFAISG